MERRIKRPMFLIALAVGLSILQATIAHPPVNLADDNAGSASNPYLISSIENLRWLSETPTAWGSETELVHYSQTVDIDASDTQNWNDGRGFLPIGIAELREQEHHEMPFYGVYYGNGFYIKNIYMDHTEDIGRIQSVGLFGYIKNSSLNNISMVDVEIYGGKGQTGALVGTLSDSNIQNCFSSGTVYSSTSATGGLVGGAYNMSLLYSSSIATIIGSGKGNIGGLVGIMVESSMENSFYKGHIQSPPSILMSGEYLTSKYHDLTSQEFIDLPSNGGLVGYIGRSTIVQSYASGRDIHENVRPIAGSMWKSKIEKCFWDKDMFQKYHRTFIQKVFELFSEMRLFFSKSRGVVSQKMTISATFKKNNWDFDNVWTIDPLSNYGYPYLKDTKI